MRKSNFTQLTILSVFLVMIFQSPVFASKGFKGDPIAGGTWESLGHNEGVSLFRKRLEESSIFAVRGDILIEKPVGVVAGAIYDHTRWTKWTDGLAYSKLLHQARDAKKIVYQAFDLPAVVKDRDVIYAFWIEPRGKGLLIEGRTLQEVTQTHPIQSVGVRADLIVGRWILTPKTPTTTLLRLEVLMNPKGWFPNWFVNILQKRYPVTILTGLRKYLQESNVAPLSLPIEPMATTNTIPGPRSSE
ncbi:MAG: START domain-containing protein [Myxococcota bacterium]|nr:START domain-containing protein [Myxococcota bacterium]